MPDGLAVRSSATRRSLLRRGGAALALTLLGHPLGGPAAAATLPGLDLRYAVSVAGVQVARLGLKIVVHGNALATSFIVRNEGLAAWIGGTSLIEMSGTSVSGPKGPLPAVFHAVEQKPDRVRRIQIHYDGTGGIEGLIYHNNGRLKDSEVPADLQDGTVDPLTALLRVRAWLPSAVAGSGPRTTSQPIFDGRKRYDLVATYLGPSTWQGKPVRELKVQLVARYGFDRSDTFMTFADEPNPRWVRVLVGDDERRTPIYGETVNGSLASTVTLVADCDKTAGADVCTSLLP